MDTSIKWHGYTIYLSVTAPRHGYFNPIDGGHPPEVGEVVVLRGTAPCGCHLTAAQMEGVIGDDMGEVEDMAIKEVE